MLDTNDNIKKFVDCFPHLYSFSKKDSKDETTFSKITKYDFKGSKIASAIYENPKKNEDKIYQNIIKEFDSKSNFNQSDIIKSWLNIILYKRSAISTSSLNQTLINNNINSILKVIDLLDSSMYENHYQNLNLVFTIDSTLDFNICSNDFEYITNIDFSSNVYLEVKKNSFEFKEINLERRNYIQNDYYIPKKFENYSYLLEDYDNLLFTFHYMANGDVFILSKYNIDSIYKEIDLNKYKSLTMIASRRNNKWTCYDNKRLEKLFYGRFDRKTIGKNLLKIAFELSHQRKGGLIIYDIKNQITNHIINDDYSLINSHKIKFMKDLKDIINVTKSGLSINNNSFEKLKNLMIMDGCVIFDDYGLISTGSILSLKANTKFIDDTIEKEYKNVTGARSAASLFAHKLNGRVLKISQNGTITLYSIYYRRKITIEFL